MNVDRNEYRKTRVTELRGILIGKSCVELCRCIICVARTIGRVMDYGTLIMADAGDVAC